MTHRTTEEQLAYDEGYNKGHSEGFDEGYADAEGYDKDHSEGFDEGYDKGHSEGFDEGYADAERNQVDAIHEAVNETLEDLEEAIASLKTDPTHARNILQRMFQEAKSNYIAPIL